MNIELKKYFEKDPDYHKDLKLTLHDKLFNKFINTCFFSFVPDDFTETYNYRTSFHIAEFLIEYVKDKHFCHIGGASGDLELLLSKYAKRITIVEKNAWGIKNVTDKKNNSKYHCPVEIIKADFYDVNVQADVYFTWCGYKYDYGIVTHIMKKYNYCKVFASNIPKYYYDNRNLNNITPTNYLIPFDENFDISYYHAKMLKNNDNIIIVHNDDIYSYTHNENEIKYNKKIKRESFDFSEYSNYEHTYIKNSKNNNSPASKITDDMFLEHCQSNLRGYITMGILDIK